MNKLFSKTFFTFTFGFVSILTFSFGIIFLANYYAEKSENAKQEVASPTIQE